MPNEVERKGDEDNYLKRRLLSPPPPVPMNKEEKINDKVKIINEVNMGRNKKGDGSGDNDGKEKDFRLHTAVCYSDEITEIERLIRENPDLVFALDDEGRTPLHTLAISGDERAPEIAKLLLGVTETTDGRLDVKRAGLLHIADTENNFTPLHYTCRSWFPEFTELLLKCGASPVEGKNGETPLHLSSEGNNESALECSRIILRYDSSSNLINKKNAEELTPLHKAVKEQAPEMVQLLLKEYNLDLSLHVNSCGQNILQYLCVETGETEKSCQIMKGLVDHCTKEQLNSVDENDRTVLHIAAIHKLPKITEILVSEEKMDVLKVDFRKRTALHYGTENGSYPDGYRCVEHLVNRKFERTKHQIQYLYEMSDDTGSTPFMYAVINCPFETMRIYLNAIREPQFWMSEINMTLLYKQSPLSIKSLMDGAFSERKKSKSSELDVIVTDFGPITGYTDPVEKLFQQETKYLKNALWWDYNSQATILMHPLVQLFIVKKCQKLQKIIYGWILWQIIWLAAYTLLVLSKYCDVINSPTTAIVASVVVLIYIIISFINETFELCSVGLRYVLSWSNIFQLVQIGFAAIAIFPVLFSLDVTILHKNCAATGILLAYILSMRDIGKLHEEIGLVVEVLKQVVFQIVKVLFCCSPLIFGFTLSFVILFNDDESLKSSFPGPLVKVLVMMTGEFEYNDTFKEDSDSDPTSAHNKTIRLLLFLSFLICVPVAFFNLLTGFALERVMELRERAKVGRIAKQLEHIHFIESILLSLRPFQKFFPHGKLSQRLRKYNVTTAIIDGNLAFETFLNEETHKKVDRRTIREKKLDILNCIKSFFGTELPPEVRQQIFELASQNSHNNPK